ncbi:hypothetical protein FACS1894123_05860 [Bacteroidia bacterium]|nr:hypothetical protein FACS1894123_05860 [Bacteroidia bacterium]
MNRLKRFLLLSAFILFGLSAHAQEGLNIEKIFNDYGKREGSVFIGLAKDVLGDNTKIDRYKSLIISSDTAILRATREAIMLDFGKGRHENGIVMIESKKDGKIESASYSLGKDENSPSYEYILFMVKAKKMTLIYLRGNFPPKELDLELGKLKNLFIKANNKQIKL